MYMLLMIYAICNLHDMSWGTREAKVVAPEATAGSQGTAVLKDDSISGKVKRGYRQARTACCNCCEKKQYAKRSKAEERQLLMAADSAQTDGPGTTSTPPPVVAPSSGSDAAAAATTTTGSQNASTGSAKKGFLETSVVDNISWIADERLGRGICQSLSRDEDLFWRELIEMYLKPDKPEVLKKQQAEDQEKLIKLRNAIASFFLLANVILVIMLVVLQSNISDIGIPWFGCMYNGTLAGSSQTSGGDLVPAKVDPLGFLFLVAFGGIMSIQTVGMLFHRIGTFLHIMSTTYLGRCGQRKKQDKFGFSKDFLDELVKFCREAGRLNDADDIDRLAEAQKKGRSLLHSVCMRELDRRLTEWPTSATQVVPVSHSHAFLGDSRRLTMQSFADCRHQQTDAVQ
jgi:chitin synthase